MAGWISPPVFWKPGPRAMKAPLMSCSSGSYPEMPSCVCSSKFLASDWERPETLEDPRCRGRGRVFPAGRMTVPGCNWSAGK